MPLPATEKYTPERFAADTTEELTHLGASDRVGPHSNRQPSASFRPALGSVGQMAVSR